MQTDPVCPGAATRRTGSVSAPTQLSHRTATAWAAACTGTGPGISGPENQPELLL